MERGDRNGGGSPEFRKGWLNHCHSSQTWIPPSTHQQYGDPVWSLLQFHDGVHLQWIQSKSLLRSLPTEFWRKQTSIQKVPGLKRLTSNQIFKKNSSFHASKSTPLLSEIPQHQCIWWRWTCAQKDLPQKASPHPSWQVIFSTLQGCTRWGDEICWQAALSVHRYLSTAHPQDVKLKSYWKDVDRGSWCFKRMCEKTSIFYFTTSHFAVK